MAIWPVSSTILPWVTELLRRFGAGVSLLSLGLVLALQSQGTRLDTWLLDVLARVSAPVASDDIVVVAIDQKSLHSLGRWPWPREMHAQLLERLQPARVVALDLLLSEPSPNPLSDQALAAAMAQHGRVYLPVVAEDTGGRLQEILPVPELAGAARGLGVLDFERGVDGLVRQFSLYSGLERAHRPAFAGAVLGIPPRTLAPQAAGWARSGRYLLPYFDPAAGGYPTLSYVDVLNAQQPLDAVRDKIVFVGVTVGGMGDTYTTPLAGQAELPGVVINAAATQAIAEQKLVALLSPGMHAWLTLLLLLPWLWLRRHGEQILLLAVGYASLLLALCSGAYLLGKLWLPLASVSTLIVLAAMFEYILAQRRFKRLAMHDGLTGLANRFCFDTRYRQLQQAAKRQPVGLLIIDVDHFKRYNDHYGHAAGDDVLRQVADVVQAATPSGALAARIGGEEFAVLFPQAGAGLLADTAGEIVEQLSARTLPHAASPHRVVTCSIGGARQALAGAGQGRRLFERSDQALYRAKRSGRNGFVLS